MSPHYATPPKHLEYIDREYKEKIGHLIGIELGGPGSRLFRDLNERMRSKGAVRFKKSLGATLIDFREPTQKEADIANNHDVLEANIFSSSFTKDGEKYPGFEKIIDWVNQNGKADYIIEYISGGMEHFNDSLDNVIIFIANLSRWYKLLQDEGAIMFQFPRGLYKKIPRELFDTLEENHIDIEYFESAEPSFRMRRHIDSPERIDDLLAKFL